MAAPKTLQECISATLAGGATRVVISAPVNKSAEFRKYVAEQKGARWQLTGYTQKQAFHENLTPEELAPRIEEVVNGAFRQMNGFAPTGEHITLISKKGACTYKFRPTAAAQGEKAADKTENTQTGHNRKKHYLLEEGTIIPPLVDMGVFTAEGRVVRTMYDKYRQINRFLEILDDEISRSRRKSLNVIDFGCGKSYLTFVIYYYLTQIRGMEANIIGLDLKADVIAKCNEAAEKYQYTGLRFEVGDVNGYQAPFPVDLVVTLHACDTATDYALYNAVQWNAGMIFSVPCCQHELNAQAKAQELSILTRYGIVKERFSALATDAIRANLLEYCGYRTQLLEFIDLEGTPKNLLIRAVRRGSLPGGKALTDGRITPRKERMLDEIRRLNQEFGFRPTLQALLAPDSLTCMERLNTSETKNG